MYKSTVEPIVNYGCTVWRYASGNVLNVIHRLENKSARAITCNYDYINVRGDDIFKGLGLTRFQTVCFIDVFTLFTSLTHLFNMSLATGFVPLDWKIARVTPAYKDKGDVQDKTNYKPLSMVIHLAKLFERQIQIQLTGYLSKYAFISIDQSAYSTQTSLHRLIDDILENMNNR